jgi:hypothetical protein
MVLSSAFVPVGLLHVTTSLTVTGQDDQSVPVDWGRFTASNLSLYSSHLDLQFIEFPACDNEIHEDQVSGARPPPSASS